MLGIAGCTRNPIADPANLSASQRKLQRSLGRCLIRDRRHLRRSLRVDYRMVSESPWGLKEKHAVMDVVEIHPAVSTHFWRPSSVKSGAKGDSALMCQVEHDYNTGLMSLKRIAVSG